ncbi:MAG TPA: hypothetical protein VE891_15230 [Allosphingosinicella sp.]|nr:hypothetical protein [Allosphingosinicella sp.]
MPALVKEMDWRAIPASGRSNGAPLLGRTARITAHLLGWPLLVKAGLLTGLAIASAVQHLLAV